MPFVTTGPNHTPSESGEPANRLVSEIGNALLQTVDTLLKPAFGGTTVVIGNRYASPISGGSEAMIRKAQPDPATIPAGKAQLMLPDPVPAALPIAVGDANEPPASESSAVNTLPML